ncbi:hypothetical protein [Novosphingobium sp. JCM 18896]|uniref:hypothetical protein n=1 Tax=Novosphingobium sp. JCM 18896 TaxID=2989731 RepID=UPI0022227FF2|nr:hypothetical protein [Novosphingobium sp. JCM 18896]MCW1431193.1 hypothetical protein [Novosphingobium sp. JCM 18896]
MTKFAIPAAAAAALAILAAPAAVFAAESSQSVRAATDAAAGAVAVNAGKMLYSSNGQRVAAIYRVTADGNPQIILNGKLVTVPASTLSDVNGKVTTSLTKIELGRAK